jgi:putative membrane protein
MADFLLEHYLWLKALHVIAMVAWMAGLLYLPRLFVYHVEHAADPSVTKVLGVMERRLLRFIMNPAMIATLIFGVLMLVANPGLLEGGWMHAKLTLVAGLFAVHGMLARFRRQLAIGNCTKSTRYFRILNEVPTVLMIGIVILVVVQPF